MQRENEQLIERESNKIVKVLFLFSKFAHSWNKWKISLKSTLFIINSPETPKKLDYFTIYQFSSFAIHELIEDPTKLIIDFWIIFFSPIIPVKKYKFNESVEFA